MTNRQKITFEIEDIDNDGKPVKLAVRRPNQQEENAAQLHYNKTFRLAVDNDVMLRAETEDVIRKRKLWGDKEEAEFKTITDKLLAMERKLVKGGDSVENGRKLALEMMKSRIALQALLLKRTALDSHTAEAMAENARFDYLVSACTVYNTNNEKYFVDLDDYINKKASTVAIKAANNLFDLLYKDNYSEVESKSKLPEYKWLKKYNFVDDKYRLINKNRQLVNEEGKLVNEDGLLVNEQGQVIDKDGFPYDRETGEYIVQDAQPYYHESNEGIKDESSEQDV